MLFPFTVVICLVEIDRNERREEEREREKEEKRDGVASSGLRGGGAWCARLKVLCLVLVISDNA
jgi:hypothetical protein